MLELRCVSPQGRLRWAWSAMSINIHTVNEEGLSRALIAEPVPYRMTRMTEMTVPKGCSNILPPCVTAALALHVISDDSERPRVTRRPHPNGAPICGRNVSGRHSCGTTSAIVSITGHSVWARPSLSWFRYQPCQSARTVRRHSLGISWR